MNQQLLQADDLVNAPFTIHQLSSRNNNFVVNKYQENALFIKQVRTFEAEKTETLRREATCYWLAKNRKEFAEWQTILPEYKAFDFNNHILVIPFYQAKSLDIFIKNSPNFPTSIARKLAEVLVKTHQSPLLDLLRDNYPQYFPGELPFVFKMATDWFKSSWRENENYRKELLDLIKRDPKHLDRMQRISQSWQVNTLMHGDIKFQNLLIDERENLRLIDWETCDLGDPRWDLAAVFHMYLIGWMNYEMEREQKETTSKTKPFTIPEHTLRIHLSAFWEQYSRGMNWNPKEAHEYLKQCVEYCSLKLLHTCFEITNQTKKVDRYVAKLLQFSLNMLKAPEEIINDLLEWKTS